MRKALITGGAGFVGYHLSKYLLANNYEVTIIDDLSGGKKANVDKEAIFFKLNINKKHSKLEKIIKNTDIIFHLAAKVELQESIVSPSETMQTNIVGTLNLIEISIKYKKKIIFASSCSVYPISAKSKLNEKNTKKPNSPYAMSKSLAEDLLIFYTKKGVLDSCILRFFNIYGPRQNIDSQYAAVVAKFIDKSKKNEALTLYNKGLQSRDLIHVHDVCKAYLLVDKKNLTGIFNIGTGKATKIKDLAKIIINISKSGKITNGKKQQDDAFYSCADIAKIKKAGLKNLMPIKDGIKKLLNET